MNAPPKLSVQGDDYGRLKVNCCLRISRHPAQKRKKSFQTMGRRKYIRM